MGFKIAEAFVEIKADNTGLREQVDRDVKEASAGQDIKVGLSVKEGAVGGLMANLTPLILPAVQSVGQLTGALGLIPAAAAAAGVAFGAAKIGLSGFSDAVKKGGDDLKALSPNARDAATAIRGLGPAWNNLHLDVQQRLFQGVSKDIQRLGIVDLPVLRRGLDATATSLNLGVHYFTAWATSSKTVSDFKLIMDNSAISTGNLMRALQPVLGIIRNLAAEGSTFLPQLSSGFALVAQHAADFVSHARQTGQLHDWIQTGIDAVHKLFEVFGNVLQIIVKIGTAPPLFGTDFLSALVTVTDLILKLITQYPQLIQLVEAALVTWRAWTIAQWALNAAMSANPITLVVGLIAGLVAAVVVATGHTQDFINWMTKLWTEISNAVMPVLKSLWDQIRTQLIPAFEAFVLAMGPIVDFLIRVLGPTVTNTWNTVTSIIRGAVQVVTGILQAFAGLATGNWQQFWNGIHNIVDGIWTAIAGTVRGGVNQVINLLNGLVGDADTVLGFLHIALIPKVPLLASGGTVGKGFTTNGPMAIVGEGDPNHPEYVIPTDPAHRKNALALYQSLGAQLMADGGIVGTVTSWLGGGATAAMNAIISRLAAVIPAGMFRDIATSVGHMTAEGVKNLLDSVGAFFGPVGGSGVTRWTDMVLQALSIVGQPASLLQTVLRRMNQESGGNPLAINRTDSNWLQGTPSVGLMQVIGPTYQAYKMPGFDFGPYAYGSSENPLSNTLASMRYTMSRYGSLPAGYNRPGGYDNGGLLPTGLSHVYNGTGRPEAVFTAKQMDALTKNKGRTVNVYVTQQSGSPQETGRAVALALRTVA